MGARRKLRPALQVGSSATGTDEHHRLAPLRMVESDLADHADHPGMLDERRRVEKHEDAVLRRLDEVCEGLDQLARARDRVTARDGAAQTLHHAPGEQPQPVEVRDLLGEREEAALLRGFHDQDRETRAQQQLQLFLFVHTLSL
jgi:hypothetical protein